MRDRCAWSAKPAASATSTSGRFRRSCARATVETAHQGIAIRARAERRAKLAGEIVSSQSGDCFQFGGADHAGRLGIEELPCPVDRPDVEADRGGAPLHDRSAPSIPAEAQDQSRRSPAARDPAETPRRSPRPASRSSSPVDARTANAGPSPMRRRPPGRTPARRIRCDSRTVRRAGAAIVRLVRVQHDHLAGRAGLGRRRDSRTPARRFGEADGIGVMAVRA